jgi:hypothetical protein
MAIVSEATDVSKLLEPENLHQDLQAQLQSRFLSLAELLSAPSDGYPKQEIWWPKGMAARALPQGILLREVGEGVWDRERMIRFFNATCRDTEVYVGDLASASYFSHKGRYSEDLCQWIKSALFSSPTCLLSPSADVFLIADETLRYSVVGGSNEAIEILEREWGGAAALRNAFVRYVDNLELGFGEEDRRWAHEYLIRWSGWS